MPKIAAGEREAFVEGRRAELTEAAVRLWAEGGYDGTSVAAIAAAAGMTKGTFYLYFPSKIALLEEVLRRFSLRPDVEGLLAAWRERPLEEVVRTLVEALWTRLEERVDLVRVLFRELPGHLDKAQHFLSEVLVPTNRALAVFLDGKLPPERILRLDTMVAGRSLMGMVVLFFVTQEVLGAGELLPVTREDAVSTIAEVFLHGVLGGSGAG